jgi:DNA-binding response OmpR family regulator
VQTVLLATDAEYLFDEVDAALGGSEFKVFRVRRGNDVLPAVQQLEPAVVLLDMQIGNKGGIATCLNLRLEERAGRLRARKILVLLDRDADIWLAKQAESDGWLIKPLDSFRLRRAVNAVLAEGSYTEGVRPEATVPFD